MSAPQIILTPSGEELVVLPCADDEALPSTADHDAEDEEDVAIYDARKAASTLPAAASLTIGPRQARSHAPGGSQCQSTPTNSIIGPKWLSLAQET